MNDQNYGLYGIVRTDECLKNGLLNGPSRRWFDNNELMAEFFYKDGLMEGQVKMWHKNGRLKIRRLYRNGISEGEYKMWNADGELVYHSFFMEAKEYKFNPFKRHKWLRGLQNWKARANFHSIGPVLYELNIPLDIAKLCSKYY